MSHKVIIINGPSCAGKTTIAKEVCKQSADKFVHLQIDKTGEFYNTIFPKGFKFVENDPGTEQDDSGLKGLLIIDLLVEKSLHQYCLLLSTNYCIKVLIL